MAYHQMHRHWLLRTLELAEKSRGFCSPNPAVGAVIVKEGQEISTGYHKQAGAPHAEQLALSKLSYPITNSTMYISLEPCSHWGKTPPCVEEIVRSGVKKVIFAYLDPNPLVKPFDTIDFLKRNGITCQHYPIVEIDEFYRSYSYWTRTKRPYVTVKIAQSLDAKISREYSKPFRITGEALGKLTHRNRQRSDVILTTAQTILIDEPQLNVRVDSSSEAVFKPLAILDRELKLSSELSIMKNAAKKYIFHSTDKEKKNTDLIKYIKVRQHSIGLDLSEVLDYLGTEGFHDLWVEAGGKLFTSLINEDKVDQLYLYQSVKWLGMQAVNAYVSLQPNIDSALTLVDSQLVGDDNLLILRRDDQCLLA